MSQTAVKNSIIEEVEVALSGSSSQKRIEALMRVTNLFVASAPSYTDQQAGLFDDVMGHLISHVESRVLVELSQKLAPIENAPVETIRRLARHDAIEVSGPVLTTSTQLSDDDLIEIANTRSQAHLAKIAVRPRLNEGITEVLVDRGDAHVANEVANNAGARFSKVSMANLVMRADGDERLTESISRRPDIPPALFRSLLIRATEAARERMLANARPELKGTLKKILDDISVQAGKNSAKPRHYEEAQRAVAAFTQDTELAKAKILEFADGNRTAEMIAMLSALSGTPIEQVDGLVRAANQICLMVLCKAIALKPDTTLAVIMACDGGAVGNAALPGRQVDDDFHEQYESLSTPSAQRIIRFWQGRQKIVKHFQPRTA